MFNAINEVQTQALTVSSQNASGPTKAAEGTLGEQGIKSDASHPVVTTNSMQVKADSEIDEDLVGQVSFALTLNL